MVKQQEGASSQVPKIQKGDIANVGERGNTTTESWEWGGGNVSVVLTRTADQPIGSNEQSLILTKQLACPDA